ncbi:MAG: lipopolysaccharide kinase InaA family protein [Gammaproteobacteria bacterium]|nr:lipopolysaccharide kinase InaA family protein [Gammaproteobacteria bacterium]
MAKSFIENTLQVAPELTWKQLFNQPQTISLPFQLELRDETEPVICQQIVRILPGKRLVLFGIWKGVDVVVKLFMEPGRARFHAEREAKSIKRLTEAGIATPELCYEGSTVKFSMPVLITKRITAARDLESLWLYRTHPETTGRLMHAVIIELATQHVMGIVQRDCHLGNMLIKNHRIYTLDTGSIDFYDHPLPIKSSLDHLALFFSQLGTGTKALHEQLFALYCKARGWQLKPAHLKLLEKSTRRYLRKRIEDYREKVVRNSTHFCKMRTFGTRIYFDRSFQTPSMMVMLKNPKYVFQQEHKMLKEGRSSTVIQSILDHRAFVIKRYNNKSIFHWLRRCFKKSPALKSWQYAHTLRLAGIATPRPVACVEKHFFGIPVRSYFIMEYVSGMHLDDYISHEKIASPEAQTVAVRVMHLLQQLKELRMSHGDLKSTNFIIHNDRPVLIDLDGMTQHHTAREMKQAYEKEIQRFLQNWDHALPIKTFFSKFI